MFDWFAQVPPTLEFIVLLAAAIGGVTVIYKYVWKPVRAFNRKINRGMDTLLGYEPVTDPATGREIQPATPPLANRVYDLERTNSKMADALETIAQNQSDLLALQKDVDDRKVYGDGIVADFTKWRAEVDARLNQWVSEQDQLGEIIKHQLDDTDL